MSNQMISTSNLLLDALSQEDRLAFLEKCDVVQFNLWDVVYHAGDIIEYVYFPLTSIISLVNPVDKNAGMEVALIGNEGMLGITVMLGSNFAPFLAQVQQVGSTIRIPTETFLAELRRLPELELKLKRYICVAFSQLVQTTVCNRFHLVEERLARLLLMILDRVSSNHFYITQELLANMLGVRRMGVTKAASTLRERKLITYVRGSMVINNVKGLEASSCICYETDKKVYALLLNTASTKISVNSLAHQSVL